MYYIPRLLLSSLLSHTLPSDTLALSPPTVNTGAGAEQTP